MKVRNGFVSNSSSSSFLIYGCIIDSSFANDTIEDAIELVFKDTGVRDSVSYWRPEGYDDYFIGNSWSNVQDDETGKQFKERTEIAVNKIIEKIKEINKDDKDLDIEFGTHREAWYG